MLSLAERRMAALKKDAPQSSPILYGHKELGGLGVMYLLPENNPKLFGLQANPKLPSVRIAFKWLLGIVPALAVLYGMWRYFRKPEADTTSPERNSHA